MKNISILWQSVGDWMFNNPNNMTWLSQLPLQRCLKRDNHDCPVQGERTPQSRLLPGPPHPAPWIR